MSTPKEEAGIVFPMGTDGKRSTSVAGKEIITSALSAAGASDLADKCKTEKNWRFKYVKHFESMVKASCKSPDAAVKAAEAGLKWARDNFMFKDRETKAEIKFTDYIKNKEYAKRPFGTRVVVGSKANEPAPLFSVAYKGKNLTGAELKKQMLHWAKIGTIEPDAAQSIINLADAPLDLKDRVFVMFGASSAMGPFNKLMDHGATVVALDVPPNTFPGADKMWKDRLIGKARSSRGTIIFPCKSEFESASEEDMIKANACGCNLIEQTGEVLEWLKTVCKDKPLVLGNYTYLDADNFVKLSVGIDWIMEELMSVRKCSLSLLCTPTDLHIMPKEAFAAAKRNYNMSFTPKGVMLKLIHMLTMGKFLKRNTLPPIKTDDNSEIYLCGAASTEQGPNYLLAKRLQTWRYMVAFHRGTTVSINVAPSTATVSVYKNKFIRWSMEGWSFFRPLEAFQPDTSNTLMTGLLVSDVTDPMSAANPDNRKRYNLNNAVQVVSTNSAHGGMWRVAYNIESLGPISAVIYLLGGGELGLPFGKVFTLMFYAITFAFWYVMLKFVFKLPVDAHIDRVVQLIKARLA